MQSSEPKFWQRRTEGKKVHIIIRTVLKWMKVGYEKWITKFGT